MYVCLCVCVCSGQRFFPRLKSCWVLCPLQPASHACPGPHPSTPRCQRSPSRLLWQMFGCAMATPERDVPLDRSGDQPTRPGRPRVPLPKGLMGGTAGVQVRGKWCLYGREAEPASSLGSVAGEGRTHLHIPAESLRVQGACDCSSLSFGAILREPGGKGGRRAGPWAVTCVFPTIIVNTVLTGGLL